MTRRSNVDPDDGEGTSNFPYLPLDDVELLVREAARREIRIADDTLGFLAAYRSAGGPNGMTKVQDVLRDAALRKMTRPKLTLGLWGTDDGLEVLPTMTHFRMLLWAYTPTPKKTGDWLEVLRDEEEAP